MLKGCNVVMLATNRKSTVLGQLCLNGNHLFTAREADDVGGLTPQHLYITSDEEIKEGDWFYDTRDRIISNKSLAQSMFSKKIIATTDTLNYGEDVPEVIRYKSVPIHQPSQEFIQSYIEAYNNGKPITKVMVEYEQWTQFSGGHHDTPTTISLKINQDNTINIKPIKDSWNRDEVIALIKLDCERHTNSFTSNDIKWIEENL